MSVTSENPPDGDNRITLNFELTFTKTTQVVWPNSNTCHDMQIHCWKTDKHPLRLGPANLSKDHSIDDQELIRKWYERRAALSVAIAFVDAEFARALLDHMPPPPDMRPKRPEGPDKIC